MRLWLPGIAWIGFALGISAMCWQAYKVWEVADFNHAIADASLIRRTSLPKDPRLHYAAGRIHAEQGDLREAARHFALAEGTKDPQLAAQAKLALGNLYLPLGLAAANIAEGGSHQQATAQLELARESYRGALRVAPDLYEARYNLELLERLAPARRTQGWARETDGVTLQAYKRDGWAQMKDNPKRGLP